MYYSIVLCCGMYEENCLTTSCDTVVAYDSIPVPSTVCVSAPSSELHTPCFSCGTTDCLQTNCGGAVVYKL